MKRLLLLIFALALCISAQAQSKHNIEFSVGGPAGGLDIENLVSGEGYTYQYNLKNLYEDSHDITAGPMVGVQYCYKLTKRLRVGAEAGWGLMLAQINKGLAYEQNADDIQILSQHRITFMPMAKYLWVDGEGLDLYSRLAGGVYLSVGEYKPMSIKPAWEVVPLGITLGREKFYVFSEMGIGNYYYLIYGLGFSF